MGRRSISTTKSGKFMNPTDQARKEARKRELKKNKKQRQMVRAAVLKGKDPNQLVQDLEKIDQMEYNVTCPPPLNEKVLKDKRKKLKDTWNRVMRLYFKEDHTRWEELKRMELEYEKRRQQMIRFYESVKFAQQVQVDQIPLPDAPMGDMIVPSQIPLPSEMPDDANIHSILKKPALYSGVRKPPGVPLGPPPALSDDEDDDIYATLESAVDAMDTSDGKSGKPRRIRFADEPSDKNKEEKEKDDKDKSGSQNIATADIPIPQLPPGPPPGLPPCPPPGPLPMMFRPPPLRGAMTPRMGIPGMGLSNRPGLPPGPPPGLPSRVGMPPIRLPPGPPPGMPPPRLMRPHNMVHPNMPNFMQQQMHHQHASKSNNPVSNVVSAPPNLIQNRPKTGPNSSGDDDKRLIIEAKPQLRSLSAELTKFMPTTLRIKREDKLKKGSTKTGMLGENKDPLSSTARSSAAVAAPTKDDTYEQFMKEMQGLI